LAGARLAGARVEGTRALDGDTPPSIMWPTWAAVTRVSFGGCWVASATWFLTAGSGVTGLHRTSTAGGTVTSSIVERSSARSPRWAPAGRERRAMNPVERGPQRDW